MWVGDYAFSALGDDILGLNWIWPNSLSDQDGSPAEGDLAARDVAARANQDLTPPGATVKPMAYDVLLTADEHEKVLAKAFAIYEDAALHQSDRNLWKR